MSNFFKLSEICDFSGGSQPPKSTFSTVPKKDYIRLLQIRDFSSDAKAVYIPKSLAKNKCEDKDILIGRYGASVGQIHKGKSGSYNVALIKTIPDESKIDRNYLYYYLISPYFQIPLERIADRAAQAGFSKKDISDFKIRLPSIKEQQQIVTILDGIFEGIEKTKGNIEENLKNSEDLLKSYNHSIFNEIGKKTEKIKIKDICIKFGRGKSSHRPRNDPSLFGGDYPFIQTGDLSKSDHILDKYNQTYSKKGLSQSKLWQKHTVGIAIVGATIGETAVINFDACFPDSIIGMTVNPEVADPFYVEYMLQHFKSKIKSHGEGSARDNINLGTFEKIQFSIPSLDEQKIIVQELDNFIMKIRKLELLYQVKLNKLKELKNSFLNKAFAGELTSEPDKIIEEAVA